MRVNYRIRARGIRVIDQNEGQLGIMSVQEGLKKAQEAGLDLVEVAPSAEPPVCRIIDYSKYKYEQEKKAKETKKKQHVTHGKELRFGPKIGEHDYQVKLQALEKFLRKGDRVKISMKFRGREMAHTDLGRKILDRLASDVSGIGEIEQPPAMDQRRMVMILRSK